MTTTTEITAESKMGAVLEAFPGAQRALMRRYHIGGCSSCGFAPEDRLGDVLARHNVLAVGAALTLGPNRSTHRCHDTNVPLDAPPATAMLRTSLAPTSSRRAEIQL